MSEMIIRVHVDLEVAADEAWSLFGEAFGDWDEWAPGIESSTLEGELAEGVTRLNETSSLGTVRQELVRFDRGERSLAYEMRDGLPAFFSRARNDWSITETGPGQCRLDGEALFVLTEEAAAMQPKLEGKMGMALEVFTNAFRERLRAQEPNAAVS